MRAELAELENLGLLTHPHTSAGRVPTERGYRYYADELLGRLEPQPPAFPLDLHTTRNEIESALQATTEMLSQVTRLLALVSAPPLEATHVRHVEVLLLQPQLVMVVVITSAGGVSKRLFHFEEPVDPGLAQWASEYLNEAVAGLQLGTACSAGGSRIPASVRAERAFLDALRPAFMELESAAQRLYVGGAADLLGEVRAEELDAYRSLFELVERRADLVDVLGEPSSTRGVRSSVSATSSRIRPSPRSRSSARATGSSTGHSAPSASSAPCAWTTRRRSAPCALPRSSSRASSSRSTTS